MTLVDHAADGLTLERHLPPLELTDIVRYAGASGDFNPIHYDATYAHDSGLQTNVVHGMFTAGLLGVILGEWLGASGVRRFGVRFVAPVWCGDAPTVRANVATVNAGLAQVEISASVGDRVVAEGWAEVRLVA
jgi:acyl dehydratase